MLILVTGLTGAGKTTYCNRFFEENRAKVYSIDNWMKKLYWEDMPKEPDMSWFVENQKWYTDRIQRCEGMIKNEVIEFFDVGFDILLDLGFTSAKHRQLYIDLAKNHGVGIEVHHIDVNSKERWRRVQNRNSKKGDTYSMQVTKEMFDYIESIFEEFTEEEKAILKIKSS